MIRYTTRITGRIRTDFKTNLLPGFILQTAALLLVAGYYTVPTIHQACTAIGDLKSRHGFLFSALSTGLFGGLIPFLVLAATGRLKRSILGRFLLFYLCFWMWKGAEVDLFYRFQGMLFGQDPTAGTIIKKVLFDQFVFCPFYAVFGNAFFCLWIEKEFSFRRFRLGINRDFFTLAVPTIMVSTWLVWIPTTAIVYSLPSPLQVPLFNIALCFFVLLMAFLGEDRNPPVTECLR